MALPRIFFRYFEPFRVVGGRVWVDERTLWICGTKYRERIYVAERTRG